jgi:hypothetical protein
MAFQSHLSFSRYDTADHLRSEEDMVAYLKASMQEAGVIGLGWSSFRATPQASGCSPSVLSKRRILQRPDNCS